MVAFMVVTIVFMVVSVVLGLMVMTVIAGLLKNEQANLDTLDALKKLIDHGHAGWKLNADAIERLSAMQVEAFTCIGNVADYSLATDSALMCMRKTVEVNRSRLDQLEVDRSVDVMKMDMLEKDVNGLQSR